MDRSPEWYTASQHCLTAFLCFDARSMRCAACLKSEVPCSGMLKVPKVQDCMWIWCFTFFLGCTKHSHKAPFSTLMVVSGWFAWQVSITDGISRKVALDLRSFYSREWYQWVVPLKHWTTHCLRCFSAAGIANGARSWIVECIECMFFFASHWSLSAAFLKSVTTTWWTCQS